jgi:hypothetical protein
MEKPTSDRHTSSQDLGSVIQLAWILRRVKAIVSRKIDKKRETPMEPGIWPGRKIVRRKALWTGLLLWLVSLF